MIDSTKAILVALRRLRALQDSDGSFLSYTSADADFGIKRASSAVFVNTLILSLLAPFRNRFELANEIVNDISRFLLGEKSTQWSFNYWRRGSLESISCPYPDDLDSTACAISALGLYDDSLIGGEVAAYFAMMLAAEEVSEGGPYYTWLAEEGVGKWKDIDLAVNANIGYALNREGVSLPNLDSLIETAVADEKYFSPYYASPCAPAYFISRLYRGLKSANLTQWFRRNLLAVENPLNVALCVNGLLNLGAYDAPELRSAMDYLSRYCLSSDGAIYPFIIERNDQISGKEYSGSPGLQLAAALAALCAENEVVGTLGSKSIDADRDVFSDVVRIAENRFLRESGDLADIFWERFDLLTKNPGGKDIILIASIFASSISSEKNRLLPEGLLARLGFMNLCGWIAYTIYDDFLDEEGDPRLLSLANVCLREVVVTLKELETADSFAYCREILDGIDAANLWEVLYARSAGDTLSSSLPNYGELSKLSSRSLGHAVGPIMVLFHLGFSSDSPEIAAVRSFFADYIIARQLNDDLRDWEDDLEKGHLSPVVVLLSAAAERSGVTVSPDASVRSFLRELFWKDIVPAVAGESLSHCLSAEKVILSLPDLIIHSEALLSVLSPVTISSKQTLRDRKSTLDFLRIIGKDTLKF